MIWKTVSRIAVIGLLAMLLAYLLEVFIGHYSTTLSFYMPGQYIADRIVPVPPPPKQLSTLGESIFIAFAVDSACCFVLIYCLFAMIGKRGYKP
jgi:hypothetical protein